MAYVRQNDAPKARRNPVHMRLGTKKRYLHIDQKKANNT